MTARRFRAPQANREVLADPPFGALPALIDANRRLFDRAVARIDGLPLNEFRKQARREVLERAGGSGDGPLLLAGHQPELPHPGVWAKNFALNALARRVGGVPLNLIVDNDTLKSTSVRVPVFRDGDPTSVHLQSVSFDTFAGEVAYEDRPVRDPELFRTFADRVAALQANWGYTPLLASAWRPGTNVGETFTAMRLARERAWGCANCELRVSELSRTGAFRRFAVHILRDLPRFRDVYNAAIRAYRTANKVRSAHHPAPELAEGEAPFWVRTAAGRRQRATAASDATHLRPRALTLTLFARLCLGDFFIHGIGGGKYDEVTDAIVRGYFGVEPPAYQVLSATLHLPLPAFAASGADLRAAERRLRDLKWNPHARPGADPAIVAEHARLVANEPPWGDRQARRRWFRALREVKSSLSALTAGEAAGTEAAARRIGTEVQANAVLRRRDYPWVLYPEAELRAFLTGLA